MWMKWRHRQVHHSPVHSTHVQSRSHALSPDPSIHALPHDLVYTHVITQTINTGDEESLRRGRSRVRNGPPSQTATDRRPATPRTPRTSPDAGGGGGGGGGGDDDGIGGRLLFPEGCEGEGEGYFHLKVRGGYIFFCRWKRRKGRREGGRKGGREGGE